VLSASTTTASLWRTTRFTPGIASAGVSSTPLSVPPNTGEVRMAPNSMPGTRTSMP